MPDSTAGDETPPNVVVFVCDDLAYGSLGCHGDTAVRTPRIDQFYDEAVRFDRYYSGPLCSPARASIQTGRWHYRTGVLHTSIGHSMMHPDEVTFAELLGQAGYHTCHSGTWHLGDTYPLRPHDQGYDEATYHLGSGIGYWADGANSYEDPELHHNGDRQPFEGLAADIFTDRGIEFIRAHHDEPFVVQVATDAPTPPMTDVSDDYVAPYREFGLPDDVARYYGLVTLIDECFGRVLDTLDDTGLAEETIVVFTADHGPGSFSTPIYRAGFRGTTGGVYEGGIHNPCFVRWPARWEGGRDIERVTSAVDWLPTFADAAGAGLPDRTIDGRSLLPLLDEEADQEAWRDRRVVIQMTREDVPSRYDNAAVIGERYKLVDGRELYDIQEDPGEQQNIAAKHPEIVADFRGTYDAWYEDVRAERNFEPPRIVIGSPHENPTALSRNDWLGPNRNSKSDEDVGYWEVEVERPGTFDVEVNVPSVGDARFAPGEPWGRVHFRCGAIERSTRVTRGVSSQTFTDIELEAGPARIEAWLNIKEPISYGNPTERKGARSVLVRRTGD